MKDRNELRNPLAFIIIALALSASASAQDRDYNIVSNFLQRYSSSLLYGDYIDHANLYSNPTYFLGKKFSSSGIRNVAKNFYANNETLSHSFEILTYYREGNLLVVIVSERQTTRNRITGQRGTANVTKEFKLIYSNGWYCYSQRQVQYRD